MKLPSIPNENIVNQKKLLFNLCGNALRVTAYVSLFTIITKLNWSFKF